MERGLGFHLRFVGRTPGQDGAQVIRAIEGRLEVGSGEHWCKGWVKPRRRDTAWQLARPANLPQTPGWGEFQRQL